jgi:hypothetical protein
MTGMDKQDEFDTPSSMHECGKQPLAPAMHHFAARYSARGLLWCGQIVACTRNAMRAHGAPGFLAKKESISMRIKNEDAAIRVYRAFGSPVRMPGRHPSGWHAIRLENSHESN